MVGLIIILAMRVMCDKCKTSKKNIRALIGQKSNDGKHDVGVFGLYESIHKASIAGVSSGVELAIARLLNEDDLGAKSHIDCSGATLSVFLEIQKKRHFLGRRKKIKKFCIC